MENEKWKEQLICAKSIIKNNRKRLIHHDEIIQWMNQQKTYFHPDIQQSSHCMTNPEIHDLWNQFIHQEDYKKHFENVENTWKETLEQVKQYLDQHQSLPTNELLSWLKYQRKQYHSDIHQCQFLMKRITIHSLWTAFITDEKYQCYLKCPKIKWKDMLMKVKQYIDEHHEVPPSGHSNKIIHQMGLWVLLQRKYYNPDISQCMYIMREQEIYILWNQFIHDETYSMLMKSTKDIWKDTLNRLKQYLNKMNEPPSTTDLNKEFKLLGKWFSRQKMYYHDDLKQSKCIMRQVDIWLLWKDFMMDDQYARFFKTNEDIWKENLSQLKVYISVNKTRPSIRDENQHYRKLAYWLDRQKSYYDINITKCRYIMKKKEIHTLWEEFLEFYFYFCSY